MLQTIADTASYMTSLTEPLAFAGVALLILGLAGFAVWVFCCWGTGLMRYCGRSLVVIGALFLTFQAAWLFFGVEPSVKNAGGLPLWFLGFAFVVPGFLMRLVGAIRPTH
jgi:hypothetical protein